jgi:hypothetical protein
MVIKNIKQQVIVRENGKGPVKPLEIPAKKTPTGYAMLCGRCSTHFNTIHHTVVPP